jgi:hypothetical protein
MASWRSNPIVGVVAVLLIVVSAFVIYKQIKGPDYAGKMKPLRIYQAQVVAGEAAKLVPDGGKAVLIVMGDESSNDFVEGFKAKAGESKLTVVIEKISMAEPGAEGAPEMMEPGLEGLMAMLQAIKAHPDAKVLVNFIGASYDPMMTGQEGLPPQITEYFEKGGKAVILGGGGMMVPGQKDPFIEWVKEGKITMVAHKPVVDQTVKKPFSLSPEKFFETYMMVVDKANVANYEAEMKKMMEPPEEEPKKE